MVVDKGLALAKSTVTADTPCASQPRAYRPIPMISECVVKEFPMADQIILVQHSLAVGSISRVKWDFNDATWIKNIFADLPLILQTP